MLLEAVDALNVSISSQTVTASTQLVAARESRSGLNIANIGATNALFLLLGTGSASATNAHISVPPNSSWDGMIGPVVWRGAVQAFSTTTPVGVAEV